jgi:hypothetical protein
VYNTLAVHGDEWPQGVWGMCPQFNLAFSLEEAPTFGRGSSLIRLAQSALLGPLHLTACWLPRFLRLHQELPEILDYHCPSTDLIVDFG